MYTFKFRPVYILVASAVASLFMTGCATPNYVYRNYYQDSQCRLYYTDIWGNRVYEGVGMSSVDMTGRTLKVDCNGRAYYQDSFGNRIYVNRHCR